MESNSINSSRLEKFIKNPQRGLWSLALPVMGGMSIHTLYSIADMFFIGKVSADSLAAISFNMPLFFFVIALMIGIGSGVTALLARYIGKGDKSSGEQVAQHGIIIGITISTIFSLIGSFFGYELLGLIGVPEKIIPLAWAYLQVLSLGLPFLVLSNSFNAILAGTGDTKFPMKMMAMGTFLNILLDPLFIFVLEQGLRGAAIATLISQATVFSVFSLMLFIKKKSDLDLSWKGFSFKKNIFRDIFKIGIPASISLLIMAFGSLVFNKILVGFSSGAVAAYQVASRIDMFLLLPIMAIASGLVTMVGMFSGAGEFEKLRKIIFYGMTRAIFITSVSSVVIYIFANEISSFFTTDKEIREIAVSYFRTMAFAYPLVAVAITSSRSLQGLGRGIPMLIITSVRVLLVSAPLSVYFVFYLGKPIQWVWYSIVLSVIVSASLAFSWINRSLKKVMSQKELIKRASGQDAELAN